MAWQTSALVIANRTVDSDQLLKALQERARSGPVKFTLLVPCGPTGRDGARGRLEAACERLREAGLEVEGSLARDSEPLAAAHQAWDPAKYDEIVVCTLPTGASKWLQVDLPHRLQKLTDAPVTHIVAHERSPAAAGG
jgi:sirohydrochlorin ferrochelatase